MLSPDKQLVAASFSFYYSFFFGAGVTVSICYRDGSCILLFIIMMPSQNEIFLLLPGSKSVASSPIEKPQPIGTKTVGRVDVQAYKLRDQKAAFSLEHKIFGQESHVNLPPSLWRADQDPNRQSDSSLFPDGRRTNPNEAYNENGLFSSSLSDIFDKKRETLCFGTCIYLICFLKYARELSIIALRSTKHLQDTTPIDYGN